MKKGSWANMEGAASLGEGYTYIPTQAPKAGDLPHYIILVGPLGIQAPVNNMSPRFGVIIRPGLLWT
jgi:hypothetical protein